MFRAASAAAQAARLGRDDRGATAVEYGLIAVLIAAVIAAVIALLGTKVGSDFQSVVGQSW